MVFLLRFFLKIFTVIHSVRNSDFTGVTPSLKSKNYGPVKDPLVR